MEIKVYKKLGENYYIEIDGEHDDFWYTYNDLKELRDKINDVIE